jgi:hypothetical protein
MVYVDDMQAEFRGMIMCHMVADSHAELIAMADRIGVQRKWIQQPGTTREHFDICLTKRKAAIKAGAVAVTWRWIGLRDQALRRGESVPEIEYELVGTLEL